jgi:hypothetical protein
MIGVYVQVSAAAASTSSAQQTSILFEQTTLTRLMAEASSSNVSAGLAPISSVLGLDEKLSVVAAQLEDAASELETLYKRLRGGVFVSDDVYSNPEEVKSRIERLQHWQVELSKKFYLQLQQQQQQQRQQCGTGNLHAACAMTDHHINLSRCLAGNYKCAKHATHDFMHSSFLLHYRHSSFH